MARNKAFVKIAPLTQGVKTWTAYGAMKAPLRWLFHAVCSTNDGSIL